MDAPRTAPPQRRNSIAGNAIANGIWYVLVIVSGFVIPRAIAQYQGQVLLGIWDLGLSLLFYVGLLRMGAGSAVSRYVSRYRTLEDWHSLNANVNSSLAFLSLAAVLGIIGAAVLAALVHLLIPDGTPELLATARWIVFLLAASAALEMPISVFNAVITGQERFDVLNWTRGLRDLAVLVSVLALLFVGFGLVALSQAVLLSTIAYGAVQVYCCRSICPQLQISPRHCSWRAMKKVAVFGTKSMSRDLARSLLYQGNSIILAAFLGPAALAIYTRQRNLVMQVMKFVKQFAQVFIPVSSSLDARQDQEGLQRLLIQSAQYGTWLTLPMILILILLGGPLVQLWMGPEYVAPATLTILSLGHLLSVAQLGPYSVLEGMGRHFKPALLELLGAIFGLGLTFLGLSVLGWEMAGAAASVALAIGVTTGIFVPWYACRLVGLPVRQYAAEVFIRPALASIPLALCLGITGHVFRSEPLQAVVFGLSIGGIVTVASYWLWVVPGSMKTAILNRLSQKLSGTRQRGKAHAP